MLKTLLAAGSLAVLSVALTLPAQARDERLECEAEGAGDISMDARYETRGTRERFSTEFEAAPRGAFKAGQQMTVIVKQTIVGAVALKKVKGGDIVGDLNLGRDGNPSPQGFPKVRKDTKVTVQVDGKTVLACKLKFDD
jgi:hypothetical protein